MNLSGVLYRWNFVTLDLSCVFLSCVAKTEEGHDTLAETSFCQLLLVNCACICELAVVPVLRISVFRSSFGARARVAPPLWQPGSLAFFKAIV